MIFIGLVIYCFLLYIRPSDWVPAVYAWPLEMVVMGIVVPAGIIKAMISGDTEGRPVKMSIFVPLMAGYVFLCLFSNVINGNSGDGIDAFSKFGKRALVALIFYLSLDSVKKLRAILVVLVTLALVLVYQGIWQVDHGYGWAGQGFSWGYRIKWVGLWDGSNVLSLLFVMSLPFALEMFLSKWNILLRIYGLFAVVMFLVGFKLADSRGSWVSCGVVLMVYFASKLGKKGMVIGVLGFGLILAFATKRLTEANEVDQSSSAGRIEMWNQGIEMLKYNPIFGIGKGKYAEYTGTLIGHNTFVENMGELGLLGLFFWVAIVYNGFWQMILIRRQKELDPELLSVARAVFVAFTGYLSAAMFLSIDYEPFYILLGLIAAIDRIARRQIDMPEFKFDRPIILRILAVEAVGVLTIHFAIMAYY